MSPCRKRSSPRISYRSAELGEAAMALSRRLWAPAMLSSRRRAPAARASREAESAAREPAIARNKLGMRKRIVADTVYIVVAQRWEPGRGAIGRRRARGVRPGRCARGSGPARLSLGAKKSAACGREPDKAAWEGAPPIAVESEVNPPA